MPTTIYHPRRNSLALRILRHMQLHGQPMSRAQMRAEFDAVVMNQLQGAVRAGLLRVQGSPEAFYPTDALADATLDGRARTYVWGEERNALMQRRYHTSSNAQLAKLLGVTKDAVRAQAAVLGLYKTPETVRRILKRRALSRPYLTTSPRTENILRLMREGRADGATAGHIATLAGASASAVGNILRCAIARGVVERRPVNRRHFTYHLNRAHPRALCSADEDRPVQIIVPAGAPRTPIQTTAPNSVFALGRTPYPTTNHATQ